MKFRHTILYVENVRATISFFERAFGLEAGFVHESGDYGELATGETRFAFSSVALMKALGKHPAPPQAAAPVFEIAFETEDVEAAYEKALAAGASAIQPPRHEEWGQVTAYVGDPNG